jgi:hypothetical protein
METHKATQKCRHTRDFLDHTVHLARMKERLVWQVSWLWVIILITFPLAQWYHD